MPLVNTKQMFEDAYRNHYAVGAFNVDSIAMIQALLAAAEDVASPVIISVSKGSRAFMHPGNIKEAIECVSKDITVPFALHLDHGDSFALCKDCIDEGFTSVMMDCGDDVSFDERVRLTKEVADYAHDHGAAVEGELGELGGEQGGSGSGGYSDPDAVAEFVTRSGVDSLAISVGTCHGMRKHVRLEFGLLEEMMRLLPDFPFVLHGSSTINNEFLDDFNAYGGDIHGAVGVPEEQLRKIVRLGVCKVNIGTDFRVAYVSALRKSLALNPSRFEPRTFLAPAQKAIYELARHKMADVFDSKNHKIFH